MKINSFYWGFVLILVIFLIGFGIAAGITLIGKQEPVLGIGAIICALGCCPWVKAIWNKARL